MATISKLLQTLSFMTLFLMLANQLVLSQDVTTFSYSTFTQNMLGVTFQGGTHVPPNSNVLRLTETNSWTVGRVVYSQPIAFSQSLFSSQASFQTTIKFKIKPSLNGAADGLAFFIAPVNTAIPSGSAGGYLGIFDPTGSNNNIFAVEFDTYINDWDPNYRHIGIDLDSKTSVINTAFDSGTGALVTAIINYDAITNTISVVATSGHQTASLSYVFNLTSVLTEQVHVGISSSTGQSIQENGVHDVISWSFTSSLQSNSVNNDEKAYIRKYMGKY